MVRAKWFVVSEMPGKSQGIFLVLVGGICTLNL